MQATKTVDEATHALQCIAALRVLFNRRDRLATQKSARQKHWRDQLTEDTQALNETIKKSAPQKSGDRKARLAEIRQLFEERESDKERKKIEIGSLKKQIGQVDKAIAEVVWSKPSDQAVLDFSEDQQGPGMTREVAVQLRAGLDEMSNEGAKLAPDMQGLYERLDAMGVTAAEVAEGLYERLDAMGVTAAEVAGLAVVDGGDADEDEDEDE